jgi:hypothetical protein
MSVRIKDVNLPGFPKEQQIGPGRDASVRRRPDPFLQINTTDAFFHSFFLLLQP